MSERRTLLLIKKMSYKLDFKALLLTLYILMFNPRNARDNFLCHVKLIFTNTTASLYCNKSGKRDALNSIYTCPKVNMLYYVFYKVIITFLWPNHRATWFHAGFFRKILMIPKSHQKE